MRKGPNLTFLVSLLLASLFLLPPPHSKAEPILKPKKYHGPIPQKSLTLTIGFLAGPTNEEMWAYIDRQIEQPLQKELNTIDFGTTPVLNLIYTKKVHPQFAFRFNGGVAFLRSESTGRDFIQDPDSIPPAGQVLVDFTRKFDVNLFSLEASGIYYFQDASVEEFQMFLGGGFGFFVPWAIYNEDQTEDTTGQPYNSRKEDDVTFEPGVHGVLGALYHITNTFTVHVEARGQIAQSKFTLELPTPADGIQPISFDVDYTGFIIAVGVSKFF